MSVGEKMPGGWHTAAPKANFTVTLFLFAWALLPIGFMGMMLLFHKFETFRLPIMALSDALLVLTLASAISQRKGSFYDAKIQLSGFLLGISILLLTLLYVADLRQWWWIAYAFCIGSVPYLFISLNAMAGWDHDVHQLPWDAKMMVPVDACFSDWNVVSTRWSTSIMAWKKIGRITGVLYGGKQEDELHLNLELLTTKDHVFSDEELGVHWSHFNPQNTPSQSEE